MRLISVPIKIVKRKIFTITLIIFLSLIYSVLAFSVNASPIKVEILQDGKINFFYNNVDEIFQDDCIISVKYFLNKSENYGHRISSLGQNLGNSFEVLERNNKSITLKAGNLTINQKVIYINGTDFFTTEWNITNIANESIKNISFFHGADMAVAGTDYYDDGVYNNNNKALYAKDSGYVVGLVPLPGFIPDEFDIDKYSDVWNHILEGKLYNKTSYWGDTGIAFGWRKEELNANKSWIIKLNWKFNEDNEIPEIHYDISPKINFVNESFSIQANASEFVFWQIKIFNGSSVLFYYNSTGNNTSLNWNYSEIGNFTIEIAATDNAGNTKIVNDSIKIIQKQQLFLNVTKPLNNTITNNRTIIVEGFTNALNVSINGFIVNVSNENFSFALNLTEGNNTISVTARDSLGNVNSTTLKIILDARIPLTILEPANNSITNNKTILIRGITKINANVSINGNSMMASNGNFSFALNLTEENNSINITAKDYLGNTNSTILKIILDTKIPLTIVEPLNNSITNNRTILIKGITKNNANVSVNENFTTSTDNGNFSFALNLTEGNNSINITVRDYLGNTNSTTLNVILDTLEPAIILNSPQNNSYIRPGTLLNFSVFDEHLNKILINGKETNTTLIDTRGWSDGVYYIEIYANDTARNENNKTSTFIIESERHTNEKIQETKCNSSSWKCGNWSECSDGKQKKTCTNDCGDDKIEIQMCLPLPFSGEKLLTKEPNFKFPPPPEVDIGMPPGFNESSNDSSNDSHKSNLSITAKNAQQNDSENTTNNETPFKKDNKSNNGSKNILNQANNALENIWGIFNEIFKNISKWIKWYYLLPLFLIPLGLFFLLKNNVVADMEFLQKVKEEERYNILQDFKNIYVTPDTYSKVLGWSNIVNLKTTNLNENGRKYLEEFGDEILALTKQINAKKILTENDLREDLCKKKGFKTFRIKDLGKIKKQNADDRNLKNLNKKS